MNDKQTQEQFEVIVTALVDYPDVTYGSPKGFGSNALKIRGKIFAMLSSGDKFVVKLPRQRVEELIISGDGERFDANHGRWMKEWVTIRPEAADKWRTLAEEALKFVGSSV